MNNGRNHTIQAPNYSMFKALPKPHINCMNWRNRKFTSWICSSWFSVFLTSIDENRWSIMLKKVYGDDFSAQQCFNFAKSLTAMEVQRLDSWCFDRFLLQFASNRITQSPADDECCKRKHKDQKILVNWWKSVCENWRKSERICEFFVIWSEKWLSPFNSVTVNLLYFMLIQALIMINHNLDD